MAIDPTADQADKLGTLPMDEPVFFINCHKYRDRAQYAAGYAIAFALVGLILSLVLVRLVI